MKPTTTTYTLTYPPKTATPLAPPEYVSDKNLAGRYEVGRVSIWRWCREGGFPKPIKLSSGCTRWRMSDVLEFEARRAAESQPAGGK